MTTTSTEGAVVLALLEKFAGLTYPTMLGSNEPVQIFDGIPGPNQPDNYIQVGGFDVPDIVQGTQTWAGLGATVRYEDYEVNCAVSCYVGGDADQTFTTAGEPSDAQYAARTNAYAIFAQIEIAMQADVQLLNVTNPPGILWCEVLPKSTQQTEAGDPESGIGRVCNRLFSIHVRGRIFP